MGFIKSIQFVQMGATRFKNTRRLRGHISSGNGRISKHRKSPGGRGLAGGMHHERIMMNKYHQGYFGKKGIRVFHKQNNWKWAPIVNTDKLWSLVGGTDALKAAQKQKGKAAVIDVTKLGYLKVLGKGTMPKCPVIVKAKLFSKTAEKRIKEAGGACVLVC